MILEPTKIRLSLIVAVTTIAFLVFYFSEPHQSELVFNIALVPFILIALKNKNHLTILLMIAAFRMLMEIGWFSSINFEAHKILVYISVGVLVYYLWYDALSKALSLLLITSVACEVYWASSNYSGPELSWGLFLAALMLSHRCVFIMRAPILETITKQTGFKAEDMDFYMYLIGTVQAIIYMALTVEYVLRHIFFIDIYFVYEITPEFVHATNIVLFLLLLWESIKEIQRHIIKA